MTKKHYKIASIPGDGIGKETLPEGVRVLDAVAKRHGISFQWDEFDWSCERYAASVTATGFVAISRRFGLKVAVTSSEARARRNRGRA